jgi:hypothetical protein
VKLHPTVEVLYRGQPLEVDVQIASVLEKLWRLGIDTMGSCQGSRTGTFPFDDLAIICFSEPNLDRIPADLDGDDREDITSHPSWAAWREAHEEAMANSGARDLARILATMAPAGIDRWRWEKSWLWTWCDELNGGSAVQLPNEDLPWLDKLLGEVAGT